MPRMWRENKVKNYIEAEGPLSGFGDYIGRVVVPTEETVEMRDGKKKSTTRKFLPSYVLIELELNRDSQFSDFTGHIEEVNPLKSKVKVTVSIFGRPTPVELDVLQIEQLPPG